MGATGARRRASSFTVPNNPVTVGIVLRWSALGSLVICVVLVLVLPWPLPYEQPIEEIMQDRSSHLQEQCQTILDHGNLSASSARTLKPQYLYYNYFYQPQFQMLWCSINKVASSSWMYQFNRWAGVSREKIAQAARDMKALARMYYPVPTRADVEQIKRNVDLPVIRFLLVRDPMDRFVSAYEDLIVRPQSDNYLTLRRFIFREVYGLDTPSGSENGTSPPVPSFSDFTEFVLRRPNVLDPHWDTYYNLCDPCFLQPTVIVKLETYDRDVAHLLQLAHVPTGADNYDNARGKAFEGHRLNVNHHRASGDTLHRNASTIDRLAELTKEQFERLYRRYELDFRLFQYDASHYFAMYGTD
ncbi:carbohydrate sulfotransferase 13-like [Anopheles maculipalpis]|uniref:carbohydrate sulfotransferase 13-like n=1 Tax=Anopheles maculipalpis TaxID=1496333 RepID=UPI002158E81B|nr:carbohydrate sulfotransferase 13-like [Anopheles maculipalpis]